MDEERDIYELLEHRQGQIEAITRDPGLRFPDLCASPFPYRGPEAWLEVIRSRP